MAYVSPYSTRTKEIIPSNKQTKPLVRTDHRGLDTTSPHDVVKDNRSPFGHDFRIYAEEADVKKVSISTRKGSGGYITSLGSTVDQQNTSTTGATDKTVGLVMWKAMKYTAGATGPLNKVELRLKTTSTAAGPVVVRIYTNNAGIPGTLLAESGILNSAISSSYAYIPAHFVEAPAVTNGQDYWIVAYVQDDGADAYNWSSNTASSLAIMSNSSGSNWATGLAYSLNFKAYVSSSAVIKGGYRFAPTNSINKTVLAIGDTVYSASGASSTLVPILTGQNSSALEYRFTVADDKLFWVNGYNELTTWDGTLVTDNTNLVTNGTFETNVTGWTGGTGTTVTRDTGAGNFRTGVAGMKLVGSGGNHAVATAALTYEKGKQYTLTMYVKGTASQTVSPRAQGVLGPAVTLTGGWDLLTYTFIATGDSASTYGVESGTNNATIYVDDVKLHHTGIRQILHPQLPILSNVVFHKNVLFGISAADPNKFIWSEAPGNGDSATPEKFWYYAYLSTSFAYVPTSKASDPLTAMVEFQDNLYFLSRSGKWALYGSDPGSFTVREAIGKKGCVSQKAILADENNLYFVAPDGYYRFNGSKDEIISTFIQDQFDKIADIDKVSMAKWRRQIRFYYPDTGSAVNDSCHIWHTVFEEWMRDTDTFVSYGIVFTDGDDNDQLVELSSTCPRATYAEQDYNNYGKAIDFVYYCKNDSMGIPAVRKRITRFFPIIEADNTSFPLQVGMDKDMEDDTRYNDYNLNVGGAEYGGFSWGDGTMFQKLTQFKPTRFRVTGYAYYWQVRVKRRAINNQVRFIGYVLAIRTKRL